MLTLRCKMLGLHLACHLLRNALLLGCVREESTAVLCSMVGALGIYLCRIVHAIEKFNQLCVGNLGLEVSE